MSQKEAYSRVVIDRKLREAGWDIEDQNQVVFEDHGSAGRADYVLKDKSGKPIALVEAKSPDIDPYSAKQQALNYVETQYKGQVDYIYLANDHLIYYWDVASGDAVPVPAFFSQEDLERKRHSGRIGIVEPLLQKIVDKNYFNDIDSAIALRPYQIKAYESIASGYDEGKRSFLLEMATGTGKTVLAALVISKFLRTHQAQTVLFVVDRIELASQTKGSFERLLGNLSTVATYWGGSKKNLTGANVVIATIQSLAQHGKDTFSSGYFDLVIHDEAHRSIYSPQARLAMDYYVGATRIGLTATPRDFLKNIDIEDLSINDPRAVEARIQRDTYRYFGCEDGNATFRYTIQDGVRDGYLIPPKLHKMNTVLTQAALSDQGLVLSEEDIEGENYKIRDLEKKVYLPERNKAMMTEFLEYAEKNNRNEIGKTIVFAVSQRHAFELEKVLNAMHPEYNGRFAKSITSKVTGARDIARDFRNPDIQLPRIAVSVDMLTTGYDAPEVQNIVLARPVFEPTTYQQIKGRGTRLCEEIGKKQFVMFDFCGVCEYFDEQYDWEAPLALPKSEALASANQAQEYEASLSASIDNNVATDQTVGAVKTDPLTSHTADMVSTRDFIEVGPEGDKVDREMYKEEWTNAVRTFVGEHPEVESMIDDEDKTEELLELINSELLNRPKHYFNEENLINSHRVIASIKDFLLSALDKKPLPQREEQLDQWRDGMIEKFGKKQGATQRRVLMVDMIATEVVQDNNLRNAIQQSPSISFLQDEPFNQGYTVREWLDTFGKDELEDIVSDINSNRLLKV